MKNLPKSIFKVQIHYSLSVNITQSSQTTVAVAVSLTTLL